MKILAVALGHNGSACLVDDGKIVFYVEEERLSRQKYDGAPLAGISRALDLADGEIHELVICHTSDEVCRLEWTGEDPYSALVRKRLGHTNFRVSHMGQAHHMMHAAAAFYRSGFKTAAGVVVDGAGTVTKFDNGIIAFEFESIFHCSYPAGFEAVYRNLGCLQNVPPMQIAENTWVSEHPGIVKTYEAITGYAGFPPIEAGKLMGLASYGEDDANLPELVLQGRGNRNVIRPSFPSHADFAGAFDPDLQEAKGETRTQTLHNLAYKVQQQTQNAVGDLIEQAIKTTGETNIVVSGGYGLNCVANASYKRRFPDANIYVEPVSHDGGTAIGGALWAWHMLSGKTRPATTSSLYLGPPSALPGKAKIDEIASNAGGTFDESTPNDVAQLLANRHVVAIFQGRSEAGPRALGNRSILYDPTDPDGKDVVNAIKQREWFRPFAASCLAERASAWFDMIGMTSSPHMMYALDLLPGARDKVPAVAHVDGTCRVQTVAKSDNAHFRALIEAFDALAGVPMLFNTSFNLAGDPLVETLDDAIDTLRRSKIEYLYLPEMGGVLHLQNAAKGYLENA